MKRSKNSMPGLSNSRGAGFSNAYENEDEGSSSGKRVDKASSLQKTQMKMLRQALAKAQIPQSIQDDFPLDSDHMKWPGVLFSWITKGGILLPSMTQSAETCWAVALYRAQNYHLILHGIEGREQADYWEIIDGVSPKFLDDSCGISSMQNARDFFVNENYAKDIVSYCRPLEDYDDYENLIETLLLKGHVAVAYDLFPSYYSYDGKEIYIPEVEECQSTAYEIYPQHCVVITGHGKKLVDGEMVEFWVVQDSRGYEWGQEGFGKLARRMGLIREAIEFKF